MAAPATSTGRWTPPGAEKHAKNPDGKHKRLAVTGSDREGRVVTSHSGSVGRSSRSQMVAVGVAGGSFRARAALALSLCSGGTSLDLRWNTQGHAPLWREGGSGRGRVLQETSQA